MKAPAPVLRLVAAQSAAAPIYKVGDLTIEAPWLRATPQGARVAGGYMTIVNRGMQPDRLIGGTLERAGRFEVHQMTMVDNAMRMRPLAHGLEIKPGETATLQPGGYHVMGLDLTSGYTRARPSRARWCSRRPERSRSNTRSGRSAAEARTAITDAGCWR